MKISRSMRKSSFALFMSLIMIFSLFTLAVGAMENDQGLALMNDATEVDEETTSTDGTLADEEEATSTEEIVTEEQEENVIHEKDEQSEPEASEINEIPSDNEILAQDQFFMEGIEEKQLQEELNLEERVEHAVDKAKNYYLNNPPDHSFINENTITSSHSDFWVYSALWGAGFEDLKNDFEWKSEESSPWADHTYWTSGKQKSNLIHKERPGAIIGGILLGKDPYNFGEEGGNLVQDLIDVQRENGSFSDLFGEPWVIIALDLVDEVLYEREKHYEYITGLNSFGGADSAGWMLTALAPYMNEDEGINQAVERTVDWAHTMFMERDEFEGMGGPNSNSTAAIIMGLAAVGEDLYSDKWLKENGQGLVEQLLDYQLEDGSFMWKKEQGTNRMATEQALLALATVIEKKSIFVQLKNYYNEKQSQKTKTKVTFRVEGINETIYPEAEFEVETLHEPTVIDATVQALTKANIPFDESYGLISSINNEVQGAFETWDGWQYIVNDFFPYEEMANEYPIEDGDEIVWFYGNESDLYEGSGDADEIDKLTLRSQLSAPSEIEQGNEIEVIVTGEYNLWNEYFQLIEEDIVTPVNNADVHFNGKEYQTDQDGIAQIPTDQVQPGIYEVKVSKDIADSYPRIVRQSKQIVVKEKSDLIKEQLNKNLAYLVETVDNPTVGTIGGEWTILALARAGYEVPDGYYEKYYNNVVDEVKKSLQGNPEGRLDKNKSTEHSRLILALASIGKDFRDIGGYDISEALADFSYLPKQGTNGPVFALIAFDSNLYEIPVISGVDQTTKEKIINYILKNEIPGGGWSLGGSAPADPDISAMALQALAPYYKNNSGVQEAVDRTLEWLSSVQKEDGGYVPASPWGSVNSQSAAQVIVALTSLGIDPHTDDRFIKNGHSVVDNLLSFAVPEGGFKNVRDYGVDGMATEQATYALVAYDRFVNEKNRLFDMTDVEIQIDEKSNVIELPENVDGSVTIEIPTSNKSKTLIELPVDAELPEINAEKGNVVVHFSKGTKVQSDTTTLELITTKNPEDESIKTKVSNLIANDRELDKIHEFFTMGGEQRVEFSKHVTFTFKGMGDKEAAFIDQDGNIHSIQKFAEDQEGLPNGKHEYAYKNGTDLIVKTNHFTDFIVYSVKDKSDNGGGTPPGGGDGGGGTNPSKSTITLSIDKKTIGKDYVFKPTKVQFTKGDSVWDVLQRELDDRGIDYDYSFSGQYGSVYVESIAGDGEFDHGSGSGWMYNVNGTYPDYGASQYKLKDGDVVQWRYTKNLGIDLGEDPSEWEDDNGSSGGGGGTPSKPETELTVKPNEKNPVIDVPNNSKEDYMIKISKELKNTEKITVNIPKADVKVSINLEEVKDNTPYIEVKKGDKVFVIEKGTKLNSGKSTIDVFTNTKNQQQKITSLINDTLVNEQASIDDAFEMGSENNSVTFDKPVTLTLQGKKGKKVGFIDAKGNWHEITIYESEKAGEEATKDSKEKTYAFVKGNDLIVKTNHFTTFVLYTTKEVKEVKLEEVYKDANQISSWARNLIQEATQLDFVEGHAGKVNPKSNVTRAEFAKLMVSVLGLELEREKVSNFKDVKESNWFYPYVNTAYKEKVVLGYNDQFLPNDKITREEMATMIGRALGIENTTSKVAYKDGDTIAPWAKSYVDAISALDLMEGYNDRFNPKDVATREMAIVVAMRAYHYNNEK